MLLYQFKIVLYISVGKKNIKSLLIGEKSF